jgi:hypothetical protein
MPVSVFGPVNQCQVFLRSARKVPIGQAIEDLLLIAECSQEGEWEGQVRYLPLR